MKILFYTFVRLTSIILMVSIMLGGFSCSKRSKVVDSESVQSEGTDSIQLINTMLNDAYLGIDMNSDYLQVLALLDTLAKDSIVSSIKRLEMVDLEESELKVGLEEYDKSISFKSFLSLRNNDKYETKETSCQIFFYKNALYAIKICPLGVDSIQISDIYIEKYGRPNIPVEKSSVNRYPKDIKLHDKFYDWDARFTLTNMQYHTITDWRFKNAVIRLLVRHKNEHTVEIDGDNLDYALKNISTAHVRNNYYTESDMFKIFQYCPIKEERDHEYIFEDLYYINDSIQTLIKRDLEYKAKLETDSIERARIIEQQEKKRSDSIKAKEAELRFKHQII